MKEVKRTGMDFLIPPSFRKSNETISMPDLKYKDAKSDKVYEIVIQPAPADSAYPDNTNVQIKFGKRGSNLRVQNKQFSNKDEALAFASGKWGEKVKKGYTANEQFDSKRNQSKADRSKKLSEGIVKAPRIMKGKSTKPEFLEKRNPKFKEEDWYISEKWDGLRAIWDGKVFVTKNGESIDAPKWFTDKIPKIALDGELFVGRGKLEEANSIVRTKKKSKNYDEERWKGITYLVFDSPDLDGTFEDVYDSLSGIIGGNENTYPGHELVLSYPYSTIQKKAKGKGRVMSKRELITEIRKFHPGFVNFNDGRPKYKIIEDYEKYAKSYWNRKNWRQKATMAKEIGWQVSDDGINWKISMSNPELGRGTNSNYAIVGNVNRKGSKYYLEKNGMNPPSDLWAKNTGFHILEDEEKYLLDKMDALDAYSGLDEVLDRYGFFNDSVNLAYEPSTKFALTDDEIDTVLGDIGFNDFDFSYIETTSPSGEKSRYRDLGFLDDYLNDNLKGSALELGSPLSAEVGSIAVKKELIRSIIRTVKERNTKNRPVIQLTRQFRNETGKNGMDSQDWFKDFRDYIIDDLHGEGAMIRDPSSQYQQTRTSSLKKLKKAKDEDGLVIGYEEGLNRNEGRVGSLIIKMKSGQTFKLGAGLTDKDRENPPKKNTMVEYSYLDRTKSGKPRHAAFLRRRPDLLDSNGNPPYNRRLQRALQSRRIDKTYYRRLGSSNTQNNARTVANAVRRRGYNARVIHTKSGGFGVYLGQRRKMR